jgi:hypothetical protein
LMWCRWEASRQQQHKKERERSICHRQRRDALLKVRGLARCATPQSDYLFVTKHANVSRVLGIWNVISKISKSGKW